jgi:hypothetical protein
MSLNIVCGILRSRLRGVARLDHFAVLRLHNRSLAKKKAVGASAHGLLGNQLCYGFSDDLKTTGGRP